MAWLLPSPEVINTSQEAVSDAQDPAFQFPVLPDSPRGRIKTLARRLQEAPARRYLLDSSVSLSVALGCVSAENLLNL